MRLRPRRAPKRPKQKFTVSHHREEDFDQGLRTYAKYRDLGIAPATGGMVQAHVIRMIPPFRPEEVATPHYHDVEFQMIYVLKGWIKTEFEGEGAHTFHAGVCWIQPPQNQAHRARLFRRLRSAGDRAAGRFRDGDVGSDCAWARGSGNRFPYPRSCAARMALRGAARGTSRFSISSSDSTRSAAPSTSLYWPLRSAHRKANRPISPRPSASGTR